MADIRELAPGAGPPAARPDDTHAAPGRGRGAGQSALVLLLLAALAVVLTWPAAAHLGSVVVDLGDPLLTTWILAWDVHALTTAPLRFLDANMFHPHRWTLAYTEHLLGLVPLVALRAPRGRGRAPLPQPRLARHVPPDRAGHVLAGAAPHRPCRRGRGGGGPLRLLALPLRPAGPRPGAEPPVAAAPAPGAPPRRPESRSLAGRGSRGGGLRAPGPVVRLSGILRRDRRRGLRRLARAARRPAAPRPPGRPRGPGRRPGRAPPAAPVPPVPVRPRRDRDGPGPQGGRALRRGAHVLSGGAGGEPVARERHDTLPDPGGGPVSGAGGAGPRAPGRRSRLAFAAERRPDRARRAAAVGRTRSTSPWPWSSS